MTHPPFINRFLTAVLFIDVVGSTDRAAKLGDFQWSELLRQHSKLVRAQLARWEGHEVDSAGDGSFAVFDLPARAIGCAWTIGHYAHMLGIEIRAGVHVGECEREDQSVRGLAVHVGARLASKARPGEILISKTARDLIQGSGIQVRDRGLHVLKGAPGRWSLYAVEIMNEEAPLDGEDAAAITVMLVDDHPLWRESIRRVLENDDSLTVLAEASDGEEAIDVARKMQPDVVLMDMNLPFMSGAEATSGILAAQPDAKILVLSSSDERADILEALSAGAHGYLMKTASREEIVDAVHRANAGEMVLPPGVSQLVLREFLERGPTMRAQR